MRTNVKPKIQIDYDILLSPTYQVPVLYFVLRWHNHEGSVDLDAVYQYIVPEQYRMQLQSVGIMGGISFGVGAPHSPKKKKKDETKKRKKLCPGAHVSRSIIQYRAFRPSLFTRATPPMPWHRLPPHSASLLARIFSSGSGWWVMA